MPVQVRELDAGAEEAWVSMVPTSANADLAYLRRFAKAL